jgi:hypothetical protein
MINKTAAWRTVMSHPQPPRNNRSLSFLPNTTSEKTLLDAAGCQFFAYSSEDADGHATDRCHCNRRRGPGAYEAAIHSARPDVQTVLMEHEVQGGI